MAKYDKNQLTVVEPFNKYISKGGVGYTLIQATIQDEGRMLQFISNLASAYSMNKGLQECDVMTVVTAALIAESYHFPINNQIGYCYLIPYKDKNREDGLKVCQFQMGYKGYIQLAVRSGEYKYINAVSVKEGELIGWNPLTNDYTFEFEKDYNKRKTLKTVGYIAIFELLNGFKASCYISLEEMEERADTYSQAFDIKAYNLIKEGKMPEKDMWKYSSFWYKNFDEMGEKTCIKRLLSKYGLLSIELQKALEDDQATFNEKMQREYIDVTSDETKNQTVEEVNKEQKETKPISVNENGEVNEEPKAKSESKKKVPEPQPEPVPESQEFTIDDLFNGGL